MDTRCICNCDIENGRRVVRDPRADCPLDAHRLAALARQAKCKNCGHSRLIHTHAIGVLASCGGCKGDPAAPPSSWMQCDCPGFVALNAAPPFVHTHADGTDARCNCQQRPNGPGGFAWVDKSACALHAERPPGCICIVGCERGGCNLIHSHDPKCPVHAGARVVQFAIAGVRVESPFEPEQLALCNCGHVRGLHASGFCSGLKQGVTELVQCDCRCFAQEGGGNVREEEWKSYSPLSVTEVAALRLKAFELVRPHMGDNETAKAEALRLAAWALGLGEN